VSSSGLSTSPSRGGPCSPSPRSAPEIAESPTSKRDLAKIQAQFNAWAQETGLPYTHLSRICAMSIGENYAPERLASYAED
jgi:hypothetical protein